MMLRLGALRPQGLGRNPLAFRFEKERWPPHHAVGEDCLFATAEGRSFFLPKERG